MERDNNKKIIIKIKPYIDRITRDYQKGFRDVRSVTITETIDYAGLGMYTEWKTTEFPKKYYT